MAMLEDAGVRGAGGTEWTHGTGERGTAGSVSDHGSMSLRLLGAAVSAERVVRVPFEVELRAQRSGGSAKGSHGDGEEKELGGAGDDDEADSSVVLARQTWEAVARMDVRGRLKLMQMVAGSSVSGGSLVIAPSVLSGNETVMEANLRPASLMVL